MSVAEAVPRTFDELHARLGFVPLSRIRMTPPPGAATEEDLERAPKPICELIDGVLVEKAMGNRESLLGSYLGGLIWSHVQPQDLGLVLGADGHVRLGGGQLRAPDVS